MCYNGASVSELLYLRYKIGTSSIVADIGAKSRFCVNNETEDAPVKNLGICGPTTKENITTFPLSINNQKYVVEVKVDAPSSN